MNIDPLDPVTADPNHPTSTTTEIDSTIHATEASPVSNESEVEEMMEFMQLIDGLPIQYQGDFYRALGRLVDGFERRQRILGYIQESLAQMSLDLKYLVFDLEATRRERDEYRRQLDNFRLND